MVALCVTVTPRILFVEALGEENSNPYLSVFPHLLYTHTLLERPFEYTVPLDCKFGILTIYEI